MLMLTYSFLFYFILSITKNYVLDMTDQDKGPQDILFSDDLKLYLNKGCSTPPLEPSVVEGGNQRRHS